MINEVLSFAFQGRYSESNVGHLLCPLFTLMCERDLGRRVAGKSDRWDLVRSNNHLQMVSPPAQ